MKCEFAEDIKARKLANQRRCYRKHAAEYCALTRAWAKRNPEKVKIYRKRSYEKHREKRRAWHRQYLRLKLFQRFDISEVDYQQILFRQKGGCWICGSPPKKKTITAKDDLLCIDHDHQTNLIRGLLCDKCNKGIGLFNDDPLLLSNAIRYLTQDAEEVA